MFRLAWQVLADGNAVLNSHQALVRRDGDHFRAYLADRDLGSFARITQGMRAVEAALATDAARA